MTDLQEMLDMPLHTYVNILNGSLPVMRVPGGWLYECGEGAVFVPEPKP